MRKIVLIGLPLLLFQMLSAQTGDEVFSFLRYPFSARMNALGGNHVSVIERDPSVIFHNPALLGAEMDGMVNLNYMNYISDINVGSALYTKATGERAAWGVGINYINYGKFVQASEDNVIEGNFSINDIGINGFYSYDLTERWRGGVTLKFLYSSLESYSSLGVAIDAGLSYYNSDSEFAFGFVFKNIGAQLKPYEDERQKMPWDIQLGISKKMAHAPFRFSVTGQYLNRWKLNYTDDTDKDYDGDSFIKTFGKHLVFGVDFIPSDNFWLGVGFNSRTHMDMKLANGNKLAGFSVGGGVKIRRFDVGVSMARYHPSAVSFMMSLSASLGEF